MINQDMYALLSFGLPKIFKFIKKKTYEFEF